ncbi:peptidase M1, partial [Nostoc linckia z13]|uniref:M1 family metallopeptidase n=1 Tax=Nostoc linckia TaxID=92942 RepID=UPI000C02C6E0
MSAQTQEINTEQIAEAEMKSAFTGIVSTNINTSDYDVIYQRLEFTVNPAVYFINGVVTTQFVALDNMPTITFDLTGDLSVSSVTQNGNSLAFTQSDTELTITLPAILPAGQQAEVKVTYSGAPGTNDFPFKISSHNGAPVLATLSQPYGAMEWWPCKQDLNDKIESIDIFITAPSQYISVSNGIEVSQVNNPNGTKTTHFHHDYPIPAYLVAIAVSNYTVFTQEAGTAPNTFPIVNYVYPEDLAAAQSGLGQTPAYVAIFEQLFEPYPFHDEKYGHAQWNVGGGMEHTTVSFMGGFGRELVSHELAHQWFGNKVTCGSWKDIWLNEGFATYMSGLVVEHQDGNDSFTNWKSGRINNITSEPGGSVYLSDADTLSISRIFSSRLSYNKGAMVVHMLRYKMGDTNFYQGLRNYLADPGLAYGYAHTDDLQSHLEAANGMDLDEFFNDWVYNEGFPIYDINITHIAPLQVKIIVNQNQSHPSVDFFEMPLQIRLLGNGGEVYDAVLDNTFNGQEFMLPVWFHPTQAIFDPQKNIISASNNVTLDTQGFSLLQAAQLYPNPASGQLRLDLPEG